MLSGDDVSVISPTFMLAQIYPSKKWDIWHFDLYRLTHVDELYETGLEEAFDEGIVLIEWPEICASILPNDRLEIEIAVDKQDTRYITLKPQGSWRSKLERLYYDN